MGDIVANLNVQDISGPWLAAEFGRSDAMRQDVMEFPENIHLEHFEIGGESHYF